ncbi:MAG: Rieske (2Fe-2S) protein [Kineosporiaceae bacterium]
MQPEATPDRRTVVAAAVLGAGGLTALTACSSSSNSNGTTSSSVAADPSPTAPGGGAAASGSDTGASGTGLVKLSDVPVGGSVAAQAPSGVVVVAQPTAGRVVAFSAVCTHQGCRVNPAGPQLDCPCHGSVFDAFTGQVLRGPAQAPLESVPVKVSGQEVVAG